mmetsp:Transcript_15640/g.40284  ORF Transcript_15640/g.40284 Transcript_15640/m.40284 type:complete len:283 (+) Transcript_15640:1481-2329(+)
MDTKWVAEAANFSAIFRLTGCEMVDSSIVLASAFLQVGNLSFSPLTLTESKQSQWTTVLLVRLSTYHSKTRYSFGVAHREPSNKCPRPLLGTIDPYLLFAAESYTMATFVSPKSLPRPPPSHTPVPSHQSSARSATRSASDSVGWPMPSPLSASSAKKRLPASIVPSAATLKRLPSSMSTLAQPGLLVTRNSILPFLPASKITAIFDRVATSPSTLRSKRAVISKHSGVATTLVSDMNSARPPRNVTANCTASRRSRVSSDSLCKSGRLTSQSGLSGQNGAA